MAHDLKNPFNTLIGYSDLLVTDKELRHSSDFHKIAKRLNNSAEKGYNLLENLLQWAQTQTGKIQYEPEVLVMNTVVNYNISLLSEAAKAKNLTIKLNSDTEHKVFADKNMLDTIIRNILGNAIKFSFPNDEIILTLAEKDNMIVTSVKDNGIGMSDLDLKSLFGHTPQVRQHGTNQEKGTGLGLIICKEFIEYHHGKIWASSEEQQGCEIFFSLPEPSFILN